MKHEYLVELLKANKTVIVPNLGAFSNNENPHHPFLFNEYLKFNDGMMVKHIASKEGVSMEAAGATVDKFTNELKDILAAGKEVVIPGIGTLEKKDGKLVLTSLFSGVSIEKKETTKVDPPKAETPKAETPKAETPKVEAPKIVVPKVETPKAETPKVEAPKIVVPKVETPKVETPKVETPKVETPKVEIPKIEAPKVEEKKVEASVNTPKPDLKKAENESKEKEKALAKEKELKVKEAKEKEKLLAKENKAKEAEAKAREKALAKEARKKEKALRPKKSRKWVWIMLLIILLGGGGTAGFLYKDEIMKMVGMSNGDSASKEKEGEEKSKDDSKEKDAEVKTDEVDDTSNQIDSTAIENSTETEVVETPVKEEPVIKEEPKEEIKIVAADTSTPGTYYIIVGCFQHQEHAQNMISKVSGAGLTPTNVGTFGGLQHIAAGSAPDLQSAISQANSIKGSFPKLWILKR